MKSKAPEIVTLVLLLGAILFPPWLTIAGVNEGVAFYDTEWAFIFAGPSEEYVEGRVDIALLVVELVIIGATYHLLKKLLERSE
jgi:hypothetical protein